MRTFQPTRLRSVTAAVALAAVTVAASCETVPRDEEPAARADAAPPELRFEGPTDPTAMAGVDLLPPTGAGAIAYRVTEGDAAGRTVHIEPTDPDEAGWRRQRPDGRVEHLEADADGNLVLTAVEDAGHNALTRYDPPMMVLPIDLAPGESRTYQYELRVFYLDRPERRRESGRSELTVTHRADQPIATGDGRVLQAHHIHSASTTRVGLARVESTSDAWYAPGVGLVAQDFEERLRALIVNRAESWRLVLADDPAE